MAMMNLSTRTLLTMACHRWRWSVLALLALSPGARLLAHGSAEHAASAPAFDAAHALVTEFGRQGDPKRVSRTVRVDMADSMRFTPAVLSVQRGQTIRFVVRNGGQQLHEMVLGSAEALRAHAELMRKFPDMEHADANMAHVRPGAQGEIIWQFTQAGEFQFACLQPGHYEAGMVGRVSVR